MQNQRLQPDLLSTLMRLPVFLPLLLTAQLPPTLGLTTAQMQRQQQTLKVLWQKVLLLILEALPHRVWVLL
jgi:hypothetical protein